MSAFRLAHISDLHLPPPARRDGAGELALKRLLSRFAWTRKQHRHSPDALEAIVSDLQAQAPDHIVITGDLTNFSTAGEFAAARAWLEGLAPAEAVTISPGNHDALVGAGGPVRFAGWRPWLGDQGDLVFPQVRRRGPVALVNLCSAIPTALHLAQGALDPAQLERLSTLLRELADEGLFRLLLLHHPPAPGVVSRRKALRNASGLLSVLEAEGAELVLHGHAHTATVAAVAGPRGPIPVLGVPSASGAGGHEPAARWHGFEISKTDEGWLVRVVARGLSEDGAVAEFGRYLLQSPQRG